LFFFSFSFFFFVLYQICFELHERPPSLSYPHRTLCFPTVPFQFLCISELGIICGHHLWTSFSSFFFSFFFFFFCSPVSNIL
jgi:hypothetical protein